MSKQTPQRSTLRNNPVDFDSEALFVAGLPCAGPKLRLAELCPPYRPGNATAFPQHVLDAEDIRAAFAELDANSWIEHRLGRMQLRCLPVEQLMEAADRPPAPLVADARERERYEGVNLALQDAGSGQMKAMARLARQCSLARGSGRRLLTLRYTLESLCVLPVQRNRGYDRVLASGIAALITRELETLTQALWHTHTCAVQVVFAHRLADSAGPALHGIVAGRLRDELVAQDSLLQLDGKLSRFLPLRA